MAPLITVALPVRDQVSSIEAAVSSVLRQRVDLEVIVADDGSTDGTAEAVRAIGDSRVRLVCDGDRLGIVKRLNQISQIARGEYLARMDGDDICHPDRLVRQASWFSSHPHCDVLATGAWVFDEQGRVTGRRHCFPLPTRRSAPLGHGPLLHPTVMARTTWFQENPYDSAFPRAEDKELWARTWCTAVYDRIVEPLLFYFEPSRLRPGPYKQGCDSSRRILRRYGPDLVGRSGTLARLAGSHAVELLTVAAHGAGVDSAVLRLRSQRATAEEMAEAQALLNDLRSAA